MEGEEIAMIGLSAESFHSNCLTSMSSQCED